jgi:hypothetical protein
MYRLMHRCLPINFGEVEQGVTSCQPQVEGSMFLRLELARGRHMPLRHQAYVTFDKRLARDGHGCAGASMR